MNPGKKEENYTIKRVTRLPKRGNRNLIYVLIADNIDRFYIWNLNGTYDIVTVGGSSGGGEYTLSELTGSNTVNLLRDGEIVSTVDLSSLAGGSALNLQQVTDNGPSSTTNSIDIIGGRSTLQILADTSNFAQLSSAGLNFENDTDSNFLTSYSSSLVRYRAASNKEINISPQENLASSPLNGTTNYRWSHRGAVTQTVATLDDTLSEATLNLTSAQLLANAPSAPVYEIIPAPGAGRVLDIISVVVINNTGGTNFNNGNSSFKIGSLTYNDNYSFSAPFLANSQFIRKVFPFTANEVTNQIAPNQPFTFDTVAGNTAGDGNLSIRVSYKIITI